MGVPALCHEGMEVFEMSLSPVIQEEGSRVEKLRYREGRDARG